MRHYTNFRFRRSRRCEVSSFFKELCSHELYDGRISTTLSLCMEAHHYGIACINLRNAIFMNAIMRTTSCTCGEHNSLPVVVFAVLYIRFHTKIVFNNSECYVFEQCSRHGMVRKPICLTLIISIGPYSEH